MGATYPFLDTCCSLFLTVRSECVTGVSQHMLLIIPYSSSWVCYRCFSTHVAHYSLQFVLSVLQVFLNTCCSLFLTVRPECVTGVSQHMLLIIPYSSSWVCYRCFSTHVAHYSLQFVLSVLQVFLNTCCSLFLTVRPECVTGVSQHMLLIIPYSSSWVCYRCFSTHVAHYSLQFVLRFSGVLLLMDIFSLIR